jgi:hypothetical protein
MQEPTEDTEASISTENVREGPNLNLVEAHRRPTKRTLPCDLKVGDLDPVPLLPPQAEDIRAMKKPRLEKPFSAPTDEAARKLSSNDTAVSLPAAAAAAAAAAADNTDVDLVKGAQGTVHWTTEEDAELKSAVTNTSKKKYGEEYRIDWGAIAALVTGRTQRQCYNRWKDVLNPIIYRAIGRTGTCVEEEASKLKDEVQKHDTGKWEADEDTKLKDAVQTHGDNNWGAIAALFTGRKQRQCYNRWHELTDTSIDPARGRTDEFAEDKDTKLKDGVETHDTGKWAEVEDTMLKDAINTHGNYNWGAIAALVTGRTQRQCYNRWHDLAETSIDRASECTSSDEDIKLKDAAQTHDMGKWAEDEDTKLKDAVQTYGDKKWGAVAALVTGRTQRQCYNRWHDLSNTSIDRLREHMGKCAEDEYTRLKDAVQTHDTGTWAEDEDTKLKDAVQTHGDKKWGAVAALVTGRTQRQCYNRWHDLSSTSIDPARGRAGKWSAFEDSKLKYAVQTHGGQNWGAIAALVSGRDKRQCHRRWRNALDPSIAATAGSTGKWTAVEDTKLKYAVQTHGGKNWDSIAALVPGRTKRQCNNRWKDTLDPSIDRANESTGKWTKAEDSKLKDAVHYYGGKDWAGITMLVPGRVESQCRSRWQKVRPRGTIIFAESRLSLESSYDRNSIKDRDSI